MRSRVDIVSRYGSSAVLSTMKLTTVVGCPCLSLVLRPCAHAAVHQSHLIRATFSVSVPRVGRLLRVLIVSEGSRCF
jgi:hypothetical protein